MDWNNDGKHDWRDDAFYNNVIAPEDKGSSSSHGRASSNKNSNNNMLPFGKLLTVSFNIRKTKQNKRYTSAYLCAQSCLTLRPHGL